MEFQEPVWQVLRIEAWADAAAEHSAAEQAAADSFLRIRCQEVVVVGLIWPGWLRRQTIVASGERWMAVVFRNIAPDARPGSAEQICQQRGQNR